MAISGAKPLIYGYMRIDGAEPDQDIRDTERDLRGLAEVEGYCFATIFHEFEPGSQRAFLALVEELQRSGAHHVVVPSLEHLARNEVLQNIMLTQLMYWADPQVWVARRRERG